MLKQLKLKIDQQQSFNQKSDIFFNKELNGDGYNKKESNLKINGDLDCTEENVYNQTEIQNHKYFENTP